MFRFSFKNVFRKKTVAILSSLGIGFGLMLQFVLGGFSAGVSAQVRGNFAKALGIVELTEFGEIGANSQLPPEVVDTLLASNFSDDILAYNPKVELPSKFTLGYINDLQNSGDTLVVIGVNRTLDTRFEGVTSSMQQGSVFSETGDEVILDSRLLGFESNFSRELGANFSVAINVTLEYNLTISGIYDQDDSGAPSFVPRTYYAYTSITTAWKLLGLEGEPNSTYTQIDLRFPSVSNEETKEYIDQIEALSDDGAFGGTFVEAFSLGEFQEGITETIGILDTFTSVISFITLIAGGMAIIVSQLNSVSARMKEFAILKSTGWKNRHIFQNIVYESLILGILGAIIGLILGMVLVVALSGSSLFGSGASVLVTPELVIRLVAFALGIGVVGGLYPGFKASRVRPVKVLKGE